MSYNSARKITVGYFNLSKKTFISNIEISKNFLTPLKRYVNIKIISVPKREKIKDSFRNIEKYKLDYLYIDTFNFLLSSFLLREKLGLDIPFILGIHTVRGWIQKYMYIIPLLRKRDIIFTPSQYTKESFLKISDKFDVRVIPYFLDIKFIQKNIAFNFKEHSDRVITFMGRLTEQKGIGVLIKCIPKIISKINNAHLNIIGPLSGERITDHPQGSYVRKLKREVSRLKLTDRVNFKGVRFGLDKYRILSESDIFVNPTAAIEEAFPIVNIEALASGVPVIATSWAGNKELVSDGKNGYLVNMNYDNNKEPKVDTAQLISLIIKVLRNRRLNLRLKKNAIKTAQRFDYHEIVPKLVKLLKKRTRAKSKNTWGLIKNKKITDFKHLFNTNFLFFINYNTHFGNKTYASLYKTMSKPDLLEDGRRSGVERIKKNDAHGIKIMYKINRYLTDYLLLKEPMQIN